MTPKTRTAAPPSVVRGARASPPGPVAPVPAPAPFPRTGAGAGTQKLRRRDDPCIFLGAVLVLACPRCPQHGNGGDWHLGELLHQVNRDRRPA